MNHKISTTLAVLGGVGAGAAAMYFLDPDRGTDRRASVRDKAIGFKHDAQEAIGGYANDLRDRATGLAHEAKGLLGIGDTSEPVQAGFTSPAGKGTKNGKSSNDKS